ncbi:MAG: hypothetical protein IT453_01205 [Planctomycetes bacterium]|nr:hypothetical protein [Planctomycetota bacterium]
MRSPDASRSGLLWLALAVAAFVALRWFVLVDAFDGTVLATFELYPMGTIPKVLPEGHSLPLRDYYDNAAGQILTGLLAIPYYQLFGQSYFALKLVPFTLGLLALFVTFFFARSFFGVRAAAASALIFALGTTTSVKYSLIASGNHYENVFFSLAALLGFYLCHRRGCTKGGLILAGVTTGFSIFVFLGALLPAAMNAFVHVGLRGWKRTLGDLKWVLPALLVGLSPLVLLNLGHDSRGVAFLDKRFGVEEASAAEGVLTRLVGFYTEHLHVASQFYGWQGLSGRIADWAFLAAFVVAWLVFARGAIGDFFTLARAALRRDGVGASFGTPEAAASRAALVPLFFYLPACSLAYAFSNLKLGGHDGTVAVAGYRYFLLHFALATLLVGALVERWTHAEQALPRRIVAWTAGAAMLFAGFFNLGILTENATPKNAGWSYEGCNYAYFSRGLLGTRNQHTQAEAIAAIERVPAVHRARVYYGVGYNRVFALSAQCGGDETCFTLARALEGWPEEYRADIARGFGSFLRPKNGDLQKGGKRVADLFARWLDEGVPYAENAIEGLCLPWEPALASTDERMIHENVRMLAFADPKLQPALARGAGMFLGRLLSRGLQCDQKIVRGSLKKLDAQFWPDVCYGIGFAMLDDREAPHVNSEILNVEHPEHRAAAWRGFEEGLVHAYPARADRERLLVELGDALPAELRKQLRSR